jgi:hypothetical protein
VEICRDDLNVFEAGQAEVAGNPIGAALDIGFVFALGANTGDAQKFAKLRKVLVTGSVNKVSKIHERPSGDMGPFQNNLAKLDANVCERGAADDLPRPQFLF